MRLKNTFPGLMSVLTSLGASICCLIPLAVIFLGLGTGAFMATTMQYRPILFPLGVAGLGTGYFLHFRERRRCRKLACKMASSRLSLALLIAATLILAGVVWADYFSGALATM